MLGVPLMPVWPLLSVPWGVPYRALIAFWAECCRIVIRSVDVFYPGIWRLWALDLYPAPRSTRFYRTPPVPRRSSVRQARNLCVGCMIEAVRSANKTIDIDNVNRVLLQPHWQKEADLVDY